jgi:rod shape-determining protein RodA
MLLSVVLLVLIGLITIYTTSTDLSGQKTTIFARKQLVWLGLGLVLMAVVNLVPYRSLGRYSNTLFALSLGLLILVLMGKYLQLTNFVPNIRGATRWIKLIPINSDSFIVRAARIQPSEIAKITYILALAWYLRHRENYRTLKGLIGPFTLTLFPMVLILLEPDLGTVLLFLPMLFIVLYAAGARIKHLLTFIIIALILCPICYYTPGLMKSYQRDRIKVLWNQNTEDPYWLEDSGYQLHRSKVCIGSGQLAGQGWKSNSIAQYDYPPDQHNDFIFAMIAHQWGFLGSMVVFLLYSLVILGAIEIASSQSEPFGRLLAMGIATLLAAQMCINIGMTMGLMPITGMNLPFVSYGGSSLLANFIALGLLINVARHRHLVLTRKSFEFGDEEY